MTYTDTCLLRSQVLTVSPRPSPKTTPKERDQNRGLEQWDCIPATCSGAPPSLPRFIPRLRHRLIDYTPDLFHNKFLDFTVFVDEIKTM